MLSPYTVTIYTKQDNPYNVIPDAPIEIRERLSNGTSGSLSIIYSDQEGLIPITQTGAKADSNGQFVFYAEAAQYNAVYESQTVPIDVGLTVDTLPSTMINNLSLPYVFDSVDDMINSPVELPLGKTVYSGKTKWEVVSYPTYTLPYANRSRVFNTLALGSGLYAYPIDDIRAEDFLDDAVTSSNDTAVGVMVSILRDNMRIDFGGLMFRMYANTTGIVSSTANPATDRAQQLSEMMFLNDFIGITFGPGGLYCANQGGTGTKMYFPSTLYLKACVDTVFEKGSLFESKGENWGDSDSSSGLSTTDRQDFVGQNGGHAIAMVRCNGVTGHVHGRFAGSAAAVYVPSTTGVNIKLRANAVSLGYACYNPDAWCGSPSELGIIGGRFTHQLDNPTFASEELFLREDGSPVGNPERAGKAGITVEDECDIIGTGGYFSGMWGNGSFKYLGAAITIGGRSVVNWNGGTINNCQEIILLITSTSGTAVCNWENVDARTGLTGVMLSPVSFGGAECRITGKLRVDNSRSWTDETPELLETSIVSNSKVTSTAIVSIELDAKGDEDPKTGYQGVLQNISVNTKRACYGGLEITGGTIVTNGHFIKSVGWGGAGAGTRKGLIINGKTSITDVSSETDALIQYANQDPSGTFTNMYHDYSDCRISSTNAARQLDGYTITGGASLNELIRVPRETHKACSLSSVDTHRYRETVPVKMIASGSLSDSNRLYTVAFPNNRPAKSGCQISSNTGIYKILTVTAISIVGDELQAVITFEGDPVAQYDVGQTYFILGG